MDEGVSKSIQRSVLHGVVKADSRMEGKCRPFGDEITILQGNWDGSALTLSAMRDGSGSGISTKRSQLNTRSPSEELRTSTESLLLEERYLAGRGPFPLRKIKGLFPTCRLPDWINEGFV